MVGDIYDDEFSNSTNSYKADFIKKIHNEKGIQACLDINGSYAFLIYDKNKNTYFIGTDQHSFIPIYYKRNRDNLFISWMLAEFY